MKAIEQIKSQLKDAGFNNDEIKLIHGKSSILGLKDNIRHLNKYFVSVILYYFITI